VLATDLRGVNWMDFSPDGKWLLIASAHAPVTLFEVATDARLPLATLPTSQAVAWRP
jgi:WD40 repeat protein